MLSPVRIWRRQNVIRTILNRKGKVLTWTTIMVPGTDFKRYAPYTVILVEFENGERTTGPLVDSKDIQLVAGMPVVAILRKVRDTSAEDVIAYGIKFRPLPQSS
ncbi:MAG: hypothetical protein RI947_278 [Candidatus Parcubacteria bacterium]